MGTLLGRLTVMMLGCLLVLLAPSCGDEGDRSVRTRIVLPSLEVFEGMDTKDALILGVVMTAGGDPASGSTVFVDAYYMPLGDHDSWEWDTSEPPKHTPQRTTTDAQGRFAFAANDELREALRDERVKVWAEHGDLVAPKVLLRSSEYPARAATLSLGPALRPRVQLVDGRGEPVIGAFVSLDLHVEDKFGNSVDELLYVVGARSDKRGVANLPAIPDRSDWGVYLRVNAKERPQYLDLAYSPAQLRSPDPVRVELLAGCIVRGRVELPDGTAGGGVSVAAQHDPIDPNPGGANATLTNKDGAFELRGVPTKALLTFTELPADSSPETLYFGNTEGARLTQKVTGA
ncbi:MAG: carboxypeptidase regulatory-like domain-containing protein, partial [bacterium]|nr:carboxypeptidase regulatory-like domain-containing protein [bacterium]